VLELLLADAENPRSVAFQLERLETHLKRIPAAEHSLGLARRLASRVRTRMQTVDRASLIEEIDGARPLMGEFLDAVMVDLIEIYDLIASAHFVQPASLQPLEGVEGVAAS